MDFGLDRLPGCASLVTRLKGQSVGVLAHAASVNRQLEPLVEVLAGAGIIPRILFGPEHGFGGAAQDMEGVADGDDPTTGTRVVSLYGDSLDDLIPKAAQLDELDLLLIDLCDVGARYYTFVWTALLAVRAAAARGVHTVVLDRPNPISGAPGSVEGQTQSAGFTSFVGWEPVPIRHALTLAEMVLYHAAADGLPLGPEGAVSALPVDGWDRDLLASSWDRPFVLPSPNMPTLDTALVYPGGCLLEGTNLSEGRGHTRPFELSGAPWLDGVALAASLERLGLPGFRARPVSFVPTFHKHAGEVCQGAQIHVVDPVAFRPVATYVAMIALAHAQAPDRFRFRTERYEYVDDVPAFDLLTGSAEARQRIEGGDEPRAIAEAIAQPDRTWAARLEQASQTLAAASW
ncbi:MAG: DUF1343 domain-containing protein [Deltaproteobacteria bacterium]|nr:DUF1343 domain-containing protein [Deltaproteobacteria bacterium]